MSGQVLKTVLDAMFSRNFGATPELHYQCSGGRRHTSRLSAAILCVAANGMFLGSVYERSNPHKLLPENLFRSEILQQV